MLILTYQDPLGGESNVFESSSLTRNTTSHTDLSDFNLTQQAAAEEKSLQSNGVEEDLSLHIQFMDTIKTKFFFLGISFGASLQGLIISVILLFLAFSNNAGPIRELSHEYYPIFRGIFLLSFFFLLYGASIFIWRRAGIDYRQVFGFSYSHTYQYVLQGSTSFAHITCTMFIIYVLTITGGFGSQSGHLYIRHLWPFLAFILPVILFFTPNDKLTQPFFGVDRNGYKQRIGLIYNIFAVILSPFTEVTFQRTFIADVLCSMPKVFTDLQYTVCIYTTGNIVDPVEDSTLEAFMRPHAYNTCGNGSKTFYFFKVLLSLFPFFIRLMQCCRRYYDTKKTEHLANSVKYLLSFFLGALSISKQYVDRRHYLHELWFYTAILATLYATYWVETLPLLIPLFLFFLKFFSQHRTW